MSLVLTLLSGKAAIMGNGGVGELPSLLFLVPLTLTGDEGGSLIARWSDARQRACLVDLRQGEQSVSDYSIQFRTLAAEW